jgi:class 3 adenylate cyclase/tetratricopeptide (TPR) repeat protein
VDIAAWLRELELERYAEAFRENEIDAEILPKLTADDLKDMGVIAVGHRRKLLEAIAALAERASPPKEASAAGTARPAEAERRQLTVLFCDLVGSTALSAKLDPEDLREVITAYQNRCAEVVRQLDGHVAKFMGDGVLAYFGYPRAHEHDAERAVLAGLGLVHAVEELTTPLGQTLASRVGIDTGLVVVGDLIGEGAAQEEAVVGDTPNRAARLQALAEPGSVLISNHTKRLLGGAFTCEDLGRQALKGFDRPTGVWQVTGMSAAASRFDARAGASLTPFIGRDEEIALLLRRWQQARDGEGQVILLCSEPGIGKSRMLRELREASGAQTVLRYECSPHHVNSALHPFIDQIERVARHHQERHGGDKLDALEAVLAPAFDDVRAMAPLFAAMLSWETGDRYPPLELTPQRQKKNTIEALALGTAGLARAEPLLVLFEDAQWADPTTLEALDAMVDAIAHASILAVITFRPEFAPPWTGRGYVTSHALARLGRRQVASMVEHVTGGHRLPEEVVDEIATKTDGVPLFVEELTKMVIESGMVALRDDAYELIGPFSGLSIPSTLHDSLMARLDRLSGVKEVAQTGACIGREFSYRLLSAVSSLSDDQLQDALGQLISAELIFQHGSPPEATYSFKHALVRDAAYESLLRSRRRSMHAEIGRALNSEVGSPAELELDVIAEHFSKGAVWSEAMQFYRRAAEGAGRRHAIKEALTLYDQALATGGHLEARETADIFMSIHQARSELYFSIGSFDHSRAENALMLEIARRVGNRERESIALAGMAWAAMWAEDFPSALAHGREAIEIAEAVECQSALGNAHMTTGYVHAVSARLEPAVEELGKTLTICRSAGDVLRESLALFMSCNIENWRGEFDRAIELASTGASIAREHNLISAFLRNLYAQGLALTGRGSYDQAVTLLTEGLGLAEKIGDEAFLPRYLNGLGWLHIECENLEQGIDFSNRCTDITRRRYHATNVEMTSFAEVNIGDAFLAKGDLKLAQEILDRVHRTARDPATHEWMKWRYSTHLFASLGRLCLSRGDPRQAQEFADQCLKIAIPTRSRKYMISAWLLLGDAALARGDEENAEKWLRQALKLARAIRHPPQLWRTHLALSQFYAVTKRDHLARRQRMAARSVVEEIKRSTREPDLRNGLEDSPRLRQIYELIVER